MFFSYCSCNKTALLDSQDVFTYIERVNSIIAPQPVEYAQSVRVNSVCN